MASRDEIAAAMEAVSPPRGLPTPMRSRGSMPPEAEVQDPGGDDRSPWGRAPSGGIAEVLTEPRDMETVFVAVTVHHAAVHFGRGPQAVRGPADLDVAVEAEEQRLAWSCAVSLHLHVTAV